MKGQTVIGKLRFRELRLDGPRSIAHDLPENRRRGIYAYEFVDETWYVGKASDVTERHAQHLAEYRHMDPPVVPIRMLFAAVPGVSDAELDRLETQAIHWFAGHGCNLTNKAKTSFPRGTGTAIVEIDGAFGVEIPWERSRRPLPETDRAHARDLDAFKGESQKERFARLLEHQGAGDLIGLLSKLVAEAIPSPAATAGALWTVTALPRRSNAPGGRALAVVSVGDIELLVAFPKGGGGFYGFLNVKRPCATT